jgi:hypothetical protein
MVERPTIDRVPARSAYIPPIRVKIIIGKKPIPHTVPHWTWVMGISLTISL